MEIKFNLNNKSVTCESTYSKRLLDVLRDDFNLTGTKMGCSEGECGACLVLVNDEIVNSCMMPMANIINKNVITIEEFKKTKKYKLIEESFLMAGAVQCGFCTPGMVFAIYHLLKHNEKPNLQEVKLGLSGNLCRCTGYQTIFGAVEVLKNGGYFSV